MYRSVGWPGTNTLGVSFLGRASPEASPRSQNARCPQLSGRPIRRNRVGARPSASALGSLPRRGSAPVMAVRPAVPNPSRSRRRVRVVNRGMATSRSRCSRLTQVPGREGVGEHDVRHQRQDVFTRRAQPGDPFAGALIGLPPEGVLEQRVAKAGVNLGGSRQVGSQLLDTLDVAVLVGELSGGGDRLSRRVLLSIYAELIVPGEGGAHRIEKGVTALAARMHHAIYLTIEHLCVCR